MELEQGSDRSSVCETEGQSDGQSDWTIVAQKALVRL